jgi:hypothetical protein
MDAYRATVWLHIVLGIVLAGQALFWLVMLAALRQRFGAEGAGPWLLEARSARWPHVAVPQPLRLPLPYVAWATLAAICLTGVLLISFRNVPGGLFWSLKLWLLAGIGVMQLLLTWRLLPLAIVGNFVLTLAIMIVSGWMLRG